MQVEEILKHTEGECKYHVVFIPKYRRKVLYQQLRRDLGEVFRELLSLAKTASNDEGPEEATLELRLIIQSSLEFESEA